MMLQNLAIVGGGFLGAELARSLDDDMDVYLIELHLSDRIYHHFVLEDGFLRRMWFGKR